MPKVQLINPQSGETYEWEAGDPEIAQATSAGWVPRGASQTRKALPPDRSTLDKVLDPFAGAAMGAGSTAAGLVRMGDQGLQMIPGVKDIVPRYTEQQYQQDLATKLRPQNTAQQVGKVGEQVGEFLLPSAVASEMGNAVKVAQLVKQGRTARGLFTAATRTPVVRDLIKRGLLRAGVTAGGTELLNEAQGGTPGAGGLTGAATGVLNEVAPAMPALIRLAAKSPAARSILKTSLGIGLGTGVGAGIAGVHPSPSNLKRLALMGLFLNPYTGPTAGQIMGGSALNMLDRPNPDVPAVNENVDPSLAHKNLGY